MRSSVAALDGGAVAGHDLDVEKLQDDFHRDLATFTFPPSGLVRGPGLAAPGDATNDTGKLELG